MTMWCTKLCRVIVFYVLGIFIYAQESSPQFLESQLVVSHKFSDIYNANIGLSSRIEYLEKDRSFPTVFIQLSHFSSFRIGNHSRIGLGALYRYANDFEDHHPNEFRLTQQLYTATKPFVIRYTHRFRLEERFIGSELFSRIRYRMGIDFPLNGEALDVKEAYTLFNAETLLQLHKNFSPRIDVRLSGGLGILTTPKLKLQTILQYRFEQLTQHHNGKWFLLFGGYIKI